MKSSVLPKTVSNLGVDKFRGAEVIAAVAPGF